MDKVLTSVTLGQCDARPTVTYPTAGHHRLLTGTKIYCLVTGVHICNGQRWQNPLPNFYSPHSLDVAPVDLTTFDPAHSPVHHPVTTRAQLLKPAASSRAGGGPFPGRRAKSSADWLRAGQHPSSAMYNAVGVSHRRSVGQLPSCATNGDSNCALIRKLHVSIAALSYYTATY